MVINVGDPCPWTLWRNFLKIPVMNLECFFSADLFLNVKMNGSSSFPLPNFEMNLIKIRKKLYILSSRLQ
jgi:hypothetical protein